MKLLNREPTEEMLKTAGSLDSHQLIAKAVWETMYDAAPEIEVSVEPVAWMHVSRHGKHFGEADNALRPEAVNLYSSEQVSTQQAEIEELKDRNTQGSRYADIEITRLIRELAGVTADRDNCKLDAERYRWLRSQHWSDSTIAVVTNPKQTVKLGTLCPSEKLLDEAIDEAIAKYEGEKHDATYDRNLPEM